MQSLRREAWSCALREAVVRDAARPADCQAEQTVELFHGSALLLAGHEDSCGHHFARSLNGYIAQWLERLTADQQVPGSNPGVPFFIFNWRLHASIILQYDSKQQACDDRVFLLETPAAP